MLSERERRFHTLLGRLGSLRSQGILSGRDPYLEDGGSKVVAKAVAPYQHEELVTVHRGGKTFTARRVKGRKPEEATEGAKEAVVEPTDKRKAYLEARRNLIKEVIKEFHLDLNTAKSEADTLIRTFARKHENSFYNVPKMEQETPGILNAVREAAKHFDPPPIKQPKITKEDLAYQEAQKQWDQFGIKLSRMTPIRTKNQQWNVKQAHWWFGQIARIHEVSAGGKLEVRVRDDKAPDQPNGDTVLASYFTGVGIMEVGLSQGASIPHEFFHFIEDKLVKTPEAERALNALYRAFRKTVEYKEWREDDKESGEKYLSKAEEMGARLYAQWIGYKRDAMVHPGKRLYWGSASLNSGFYWETCQALFPKLEAFLATCVGEIRKALAKMAGVERAKQQADADQVPGEGDEAWEETWVAGRNGVHYRAKYHPGTGRLRVLGPDEKPLQKAWDRVLWWGADVETVAKAAKFSKDEMNQMNLRWITVHPNGPGTEGKPILVHDDGTHYTVVGGAGGKLNHLVLKKPKGHAEADEAAGWKPKARKVAPEKPPIDEERKIAVEKKITVLKDEIANATKEQRDLVGQIIGEDLDPRKREAQVIAAAHQKAAEVNPDATSDEKEEFAAEAVKAHRAESKADQRKATQAVVNASLEKEALAAMNGGVDDDEVSPKDFEVKVRGKVKTVPLTQEQAKEVLKGEKYLDDLNREKRSLQRALRAGHRKAIDGFELEMERHEPTDAEMEDWAKKGYVERQSVVANTALVRAAKEAPGETQKRHKAGGASDTLNVVTGGDTDQALVSPDLVNQIGITAAARVAAEHLLVHGAKVPERAEALRDEIAEKGWVDAGAAVMKAGEADALVELTRRHAEQGDGAVTPAQAGIMAANMAQYKYKLLNAAEGRLEATAALAQHLANPSKAPLRLEGWGNLTATHAKAASLGLERRADYRVQKLEGSGYAIDVKHEAITKLGRPKTLKDAQRSSEMDEVRELAENAYAAQKAGDAEGMYHCPGLDEGVRFKGPHQVEGIEAIRRLKRVLIAQSPGSGKTLQQLGAAAALVSEGKVDRGIITMPKSPRGQQNPFVDPETGEPEEGEIAKFLSPEVRGKFIVVKNGAHLQRLLKKGEHAVFIMSPELMREHTDRLLENGFGKDRTFLFADEAQQLATGSGEGKGSQMARSARRLVQGSEYASFLSGTPIEKGADELHSLLDALFPGQLGGQKAFADEWRRLAAGGEVLGEEAMGRMKDRLSGMVSGYFQPAMRKDENGADVPVQMEKRTETLPTPTWMRAELAGIQKEYRRRKNSENPEEKKGASFWLHSATEKVLMSGSADTEHPRYNPKLGRLREILAEEKARNPQNRVMAYSDNLRVLKAAREVLAEFGDVLKIDGNDDDKARMSAKSHFNNRENGVAGISVSKAGYAGINLQGGDHIAMLGQADTPAEENQVWGRFDRNGQERDVRGTVLLTDHPSEQLAKFRVGNVRRPELELLAKLAARADESGRTGALALDHDLLAREAGLTGKEKPGGD